MKKNIALGIAVLIALGVVLVMFTSLIPWSKTSPVSQKTVKQVPDSFNDSRIYDAPEFGLMFEYSSKYMVWEEDMGTANRGHYHIDLLEDTPQNRALKEGMSPGSEGPTSISIDIFQNNLDKTKLVDWLKGNSNSNFKLSDGTYEEITLAGTKALFYKHSGLYEANAFVLAHNGNIIKFTATYLSPDDPIISDFSSLLSSLELY